MQGLKLSGVMFHSLVYWEWSIPSSNVCWNAGCLDLGFRAFLQTLQTDAGLINDKAATALFQIPFRHLQLKRLRY